MADDNLGGGNPGAGAGGSGNPGAGGDNQGGNPQNPAGGGKGDNAQPGSGGNPGGGQEKTFSFKEDRSDWLPRHRLNEVSGKLTEAEKRALAAETSLEAERKRTRALAGLEPQDPKAAEAEEIKTAMYQMFPHLKTFEQLTPEQLNRVLAAAESAHSASNATWERHATTMLNELDSAAAESLGVDKLSPTQQRSLWRAYREEAALAVQERQAAMQRGERQTLDTIGTDNDFLARHERGDKVLVGEFVKAFLGDWYEPARRSVTAQATRRQMRPVPRGERTRTLVGAGAKTIDYNDPKAFKAALLEARQGGG